MAKINYDFYNNRDIYSDGDIENELLNFYKNGGEIDTNRDDIFYLTTEIRENIISWYPFKIGANVLEIGAGLGTITGVLCKNAKNVTAVEASKRRAEVLYERHKSNDNLEIIVGNFSDINFEKKYDYIILIGVFEYSKLFFDKKKPFNYFLDKLKSILTVNGKIIIAIENRYGIKYWAGNKEDHLGESYLGFIGYENENVQTFGKKEIIDLIKENGFKHYKFYYPFPDYKMPQVIYTDQKEPSNYELASLPIYNFSYEDYNFNPRTVLKGLKDNGMFGFFANSFLIEITNDKVSDIEYVKYQPTRNKDYSTITIIKEDNFVYKKALSDEAIKHMRNMCEIHKKIAANDINTYEIIERGDIFELSYLEGLTLEEIILNDLSNIDIWIDKYLNFVLSFCKKGKFKKFANDKIKKVYENKMVNILKIGLLDFNFGNVIYYRNEFYLFDQEWITDFDIPVDYVIYFSIKLLFEKIDSIDKKEEERLYKKYDLTYEKQKAFNELSFNYFNEIKKVTNEKNFNKLKEHGMISINEKEKELNNSIQYYKKDIEFYKDLIEKTKIGYEREIKRLNDILIKNEFESERLNNIISEYERNIDEYEKQIKELNKHLNLVTKLKRKLK